MTQNYVGTVQTDTSYTLNPGDSIYVAAGGGIQDDTSGDTPISGYTDLATDTPGGSVIATINGDVYGTYQAVGLFGTTTKHVSIGSTAHIDGGDEGMQVTTNGFVSNAGAITGGEVGLVLGVVNYLDVPDSSFAEGSFSIQNTGTITSLGIQESVPVTITAGLVVTVAYQGADAVQDRTATAAINNSGLISSVNGDGIQGHLVYSIVNAANPDNSIYYTATDNLVLTNSGVIQGGGSAAVTYSNPDGTTSNGTITYYAIEGGDLADSILNSGTIENTNGKTAIRTYSGADSITNRGTIIGDVQLGDDDDTFDGRTGSAVVGIVYGQDGDDTLYGSGAGDDVLDGGVGADSFYGGGGSDTAYYFDYVSPDRVTGLKVSLTDPTINTGDAAGDTYDSIENLGGTQYNDSLTGDANANVINGYGGDDVISGAAGADTMIGGSGDDTYYVDNVGDNVIERDGGGSDLINSSVSYSLKGRYVETLTLTGTTNINATGNNLANTLNGNAGNNVLDGQGGADTMSGGLGDDTYYVDDTGDNVVETSPTGGNDAIFSSVTYNLKGRLVETLTMTGTGNISATGNNSINTLVGNSGSNVLDGMGGNDTLTGGSGADIFLFDSALGSTNVDTITDFTLGTDLIELDKSIFTALGADGALAPGAFGLGTTAATSAQRILYDSGTGDIYYDKDGSGSTAAVKFAHVAAGTVLTASAFAIQG
jgi:Ca2+-binding RTX toxin-like protein